MALKKRGFNVDRILNQQREERLRLQAESVRDREKAAVDRKIADEAKASSMIPWPKDNDDTQSLLSDGGQSNQSTAVASDTGGGAGGKTKSLFDRLKGKRGDRSSMDGGMSMPGGMPGMPPMSGSGVGGFGGGMGGSSSSSGGGGGGKSTKRVRTAFSASNHVAEKNSLRISTLSDLPYRKRSMRLDPRPALRSKIAEWALAQSARVRTITATRQLRPISSLR